MAQDYKTSGEGGFVDASPSRDNLLVVSVVVACAALFTATVAMGFSARAVSTSKAKLHGAQTSLADASATRPGVGATASPSAVSVTERDFAVAPSAVATTEGLVDFTVNNSGPSEHEFLIFKTALAPDKLPLGSDGRVNETADGVVKVLDSGSNIAVIGSKTFHAALTQGSYVLVCNLPGHYQAGMHTAFTVNAADSPPASLATAERDFAITPAIPSAKAGLVDFTVNNSGPSEHEFLIFKTDLPPDKLPLGSDGRVDEAADGAVKVFDSGSNISVNGSRTFHTALTSGHYVLVCNLPGHYAAGMHTSFTVT